MVTAINSELNYSLLMEGQVVIDKNMLIPGLCQSLGSLVKGLKLKETNKSELRGSGEVCGS